MKHKFMVTLAILFFMSMSAVGQCPSPTPPGTPVLTVMSPYQIKLQVAPATPPTIGYFAERMPEGGQFFRVINAGYPSGIFSDTFEIDPSAANPSLRTFCYRTRAITICRTFSAETAIVMVTVPQAQAPYKSAPDAPTNITAVVEPGPRVKVSVTAGAFPGLPTINAMPPAFTYQPQTLQLDRSSDGINWEGCNSQGVPPSPNPSPNRSVYDNNVQSGHDYYYRVRSFNGFGWATGFAGSCGPPRSDCGTAWVTMTTPIHVP